METHTIGPMEAFTHADDIPAIAAERRRILWLLLVVIVLGATLRLYGLAAHSLWYDECASLYRARFVDSRGSLFVAENSDEPPMMAVLARTWNGLVRTVNHGPVTDECNDFLIRLLPCLLGIATIPILFALARWVLEDDVGALVAAFLYALSPFHILYAQEFRIYAFYVPLGLVAVWCMVRALDGGALRHWAGMVACLAVLMYSHFIACFLIFAMNVYFVVTLWPHRRRLVPWFFANLLLMVLIAPALFLMFRMQHEVSGIEYPWYPNPTWKTPLITFKTFFAGYGPTTWAYRPLFLLAAGFMVVGLLSLRRWITTALLMVLPFVPMAFLAAWWGRSHFSFYEHRIFILSGALCLIAVGQGVAVLPGRKARAAALGLFVLFTAPLLRDHYTQRFHPLVTHRLGVWEKVDFRSAAAYLQEEIRSGDLVGETSHFTVYPLHHYLDAPQVRLGATRDDAVEFLKGFGHEGLLRNHGLMPVPMREATDGYHRVWLIRSEGLTFEDREKTRPIRAWFDTEWRRVKEKRFDGLVITLYARRATDSRIALRDGIFTPGTAMTSPDPAHRPRGERGR